MGYFKYIGICIEEVNYEMTIGKEKFDCSQFFGDLTRNNFYKLKQFLLTEETSKSLYLDLSYNPEIDMKIEVLETGYLGTFEDDDEGDHYEFHLDEAFFRDYLKMIQRIEGEAKRHAIASYKSNYYEICDLLKQVYNE